MNRWWGLLLAGMGVNLIWAVGPWLTESGAALVLAGVLLIRGDQRWRWWVATGTTLVLLLGPVDSTNAAFMMWVSLAFALLDRRDLPVAMTVLVATVYAFAAANKLFEPFRSGDVLVREASLIPFPELVAWSVIAIEAGLAMLVARRRLTPFLVLAFHLPVAIFVGPGLRLFFGHAVYGGMVAFAVWSGLKDAGLDQLGRTDEQRRQARVIAPRHALFDRVGAAGGIADHLDKR